MSRLYRETFGDDRYQITSGKTYYLHLEGGDPPNGLLQRFASHSTPVEAASKAPPGSMFHFHIYEVNWNGSDAAKIIAGHRFYESGILLESRVRYRAERNGGTWHVVELPGGIVS